MRIRRYARLLMLVGGITILLVRVQAQVKVKPEDEHPAGMDIQFTTQIDDAHAYASAHWTNTLHVTLDYNLNSPHNAPPDNGWYNAVRFYHSTPPPFWIEWPEPPEDSIEWQKTSFYLDGVTKPGPYVITGDFRWSQGIDHYKAHVFFDPIKPEFITIEDAFINPDKDKTNKHIFPIAPLAPTVYFKFTDNMAIECTVSGVVYRADNDAAVGGFGEGSRGKVMECDAPHGAEMVPNIGQGLAPGNYYVTIVLRDLAGNEAMSDKKYFSIDSKRSVKSAKPPKPAKPAKR